MNGCGPSRGRAARRWPLLVAVLVAVLASGCTASIDARLGAFGNGKGTSVAGARVERGSEPQAGTGGPGNAAPVDLSPAATRALLETVAPPPRDEAELVRRFKQACGTPAAGSVPLRRDEQVGDSRAFWVLDEPNHRFFQAQATLRYASDHLLLYVQDGQRVSDDSLAASASVFEEKTYPMLQRYFGELPEEPRITVFNGKVPGVGGYFSSSDLYPREVNPYSNERVLVLMSLDAARPGTASYDAILAHESQHFVHWIIHPQQDSWINEGASELAMALDGFDQSSMARSFLNAPETQLDGWAEQPSATLPHYGAGYLMLEYFAERLGGYEHVKDLIATPGTSTQTFENYLAAHGTLRFADLFRDFVIANVVNDKSLADGRYGYATIRQKARIQETQTAFPATSAGSVYPYAAHYVELLPNGRKGTLVLHFEGAGDARLYGGAPHSGRAQWWGNAADEMESTLTREFDLSGVAQATLRFSTWYDIEKDYDYAGVAVSTDGGCTWQTIPGQHTTDTDPVGQNPGHSFTGKSGGDTSTWIDESMDLTPFAGQKVLLRFYYITDQSYHGSGFAVDDIAIPEIGFFDDAEGDQGWEARGFLRTVNAATLDWAVQAVVFGQSETRVLQVPLARDAGSDALRGTLAIPQFGTGVQRVVVALSPMVPVTLEPVDYRLQATVE